MSTASATAATNDIQNPVNTEDSVSGVDSPITTEPVQETNSQVAVNTQQTSPEDLVKEQGADTAAMQDYSDFTIPEGVALNTALLGEFKTIAKSLGLKQEQAQALADLGVKQAQAVYAKIEADKASEVAQWLAATKSDKEYGGEKLAENLATAKKALDAFASPELKAVLDRTGLGNHPELIRAFFKADKLISEDKLVAAGNKPITSGKSAAKVLYG
jgi:hypothetical protein